MIGKYDFFFRLALFFWVLSLTIYVLSTDAQSEEAPAVAHETGIECVTIAEIENRNPEFDVVAQELITYEDEFRSKANKIENCMLTHYCAEKYPHICGTGDGLTATGQEVIPYHTCAVDPSIIPYGSEVMVDYGDRTEFYVAMDCGAGVKENHIDLAVERHSEANELGVKYATVYWIGGDFA
jgi:3D (Asp-Asp-Asp) domain-containing protein